jgi:hypothetical protein
MKETQQMGVFQLPAKQQFEELCSETDKIQRQLSNFIKYLNTTLKSVQPPK